MRYIYWFVRSNAATVVAAAAHQKQAGCRHMTKIALH
jgi:hypothetical protein